MDENLFSELIQLISQNPGEELPLDDPDYRAIDSELLNEQRTPEFVDGELKRFSINHEVLINRAIEILKKKSRNLEIGIYLCVSLFSKQGYIGLCYGLKILNTILDTEEFYPVDLELRKEAIEWLRRLEPKIKETSANHGDLEKINECIELMNSLTAIVKEKITDDDILKGIKGSLESVQVGLTEQKTENIEDGNLIKDKQVTGTEVPQPTMKIDIPQIVADNYEVVIEEANRLFNQNGHYEALLLLGDKLKTTISRREAFILKLHLAKLCIKSSRPLIASIVLDTLKGDIDTYKLGEWEPQLKVEFLITSFECKKQTGLASEKKDKETEQLYKDLCELDLTAALKENQRIRANNS